MSANGALPKGWNWSTLGDLCRPSQYGWTTKAATDGAVKFLRTTDITHGPVQWQTVPFCTEAPEDLERYRLSKGDIVISRAGSVGFSALIDEVPTDAVFASYLIRFRPTDGRMAPYLALYLQSPEYWRAIGAQAVGIALANVNAKKLSAIPVPVPPRGEQARIVAVIEAALCQVDAGVGSFASAARLGALYERAVLQQALGNCVVPVDGDEGSSALPELPSTWDWSTVAEEGVVQLGRMLNKERSTGPHLKPYLRVANVLDDRLDLSNVKEMDFPPGEYERYLLHAGDILLNEGQSPELLGRAAMYRGERPGLCFQKTLLRFQAGPRVDAEFALLVFRHYLYAGRFRRESRITTGIGHLTQVRFAAMEFPVPPRAEQEEIVQHVRQQLDSAEYFHEVILKAQEDAATLKASLLNDAFSGGLSCWEPDDQPVGALVATIHASRVEPDSDVRRRRNMSRAVLIEE